MQTNHAVRPSKGVLTILVAYLILGPILGAVVFVPANSIAVLIGGDAAEARLVFLGGILLLPVFFLVGLPAGAACGVAAVVESRWRGRPGWLFPLLISIIGALVVHGRAGAESPALMPLLVCHLAAAAVCTVAARHLAKQSVSQPPRCANRISYGVS